MITRKEVAERAGVSVAVVSYVLNNKSFVKDETRRKVIAAMEELGYQPNLVARSLKTKKSNQLAVLINYFGDPFESGVLLHIEAAARQKGYTVFFQPYIEEQEEQLKSQFMGRIDGLILLGQSLKESTVAHFRRINIPLLTVTSPVDRNAEVPMIDVDWEQEYIQLIRHLKDQGHRHIAYISNGDVRHHHEYRFQAFLRAMKSENCSFEPNLLFSGGGRLERTYHLMMKKLPELLPVIPFTAIVCANDLMAAGVLASCRDLGIDVPGQLAVAGSEDILMSSHTNPPLTTIHYPRESLYEHAMQILLEQMNGEIVGSLTLEASLKVRESTLTVY